MKRCLCNNGSKNKPDNPGNFVTYDGENDSKKCCEEKVHNFHIILQGAVNGVKVCACNDLDIFENANCRNQLIVSWCTLVLSSIIKFMNYSFSIASFTTSLNNSVLLLSWKFLVKREVSEVFLTFSRCQYLKKWGYSSIGCHIIATNCDIIGNI